MHNFLLLTLNFLCSWSGCYFSIQTVAYNELAKQFFFFFFRINGRVDYCTILPCFAASMAVPREEIFLDSKCLKCPSLQVCLWMTISFYAFSFEIWLLTKLVDTIIQCVLFFQPNYFIINFHGINYDLKVLHWSNLSGCFVIMLLNFWKLNFLVTDILV